MSDEKPPTLPRVDSPIDTPEKIVEESLREVQVAIDRTSGDDGSVPSDDPRWYPLITALVANFGLAFLMETLRRVNPDAAAAAARELWDIWDAGDTIGELTWEWRKQIADGQPIDSGRGGQGYIFARMLGGAA